MTDPIGSPQPSRLPKSTASAPAATDETLRSAARALEASFLAEMLKSAGLGAQRQTFNGGAGEDQFASFLRQEQAKAMVEAGGIGLSESLYQALKVRTDGTE